MTPTRRRSTSDIQGFYQRLGTEIAKGRTERGLTQGQLGGAIGEAQATISDYEKGKMRIPLDVIATIEDVFQVARGTLLIDADHVRLAGTSTVTAIKRDTELDDEGRGLVLSLYEYCVRRVQEDADGDDRNLALEEAERWGDATRRVAERQARSRPQTRQAG